MVTGTADLGETGMARTGTVDMATGMDRTGADVPVTCVINSGKATTRIGKAAACAGAGLTRNDHSLEAVAKEVDTRKADMADMVTDREAVSLPDQRPVGLPDWRDSVLWPVGQAPTLA